MRHCVKAAILYTIHFCSYVHYSHFLHSHYPPYSHFADQFYPFGREVGDEELTPGIVPTPETSSPPLTLTPPFRFFSNDEDTIYVRYIMVQYITHCNIGTVGHQPLVYLNNNVHICLTATSCPHTYMQVNTNGALSFNQDFHEQFPQPFPFNSLALISPYWENFETQRFGRVYYRNTADPALLRRAKYHLQDIFPSAQNFFPSYLFIATWDNVPQFGIAGDPNLVSSSLVTIICYLHLFTYSSSHIFLCIEGAKA